MQGDGSIGCLEDINQEDNEVQMSGCEIQGYESVIQCVSKDKHFRLLEPMTLCDVQCPDNCS